MWQIRDEIRREARETGVKGHAQLRNEVIEPIGHGFDRLTSGQICTSAREKRRRVGSAMKDIWCYSTIVNGFAR